MQEYSCLICHGYYYSASNNPDFTKCPYCGGREIKKELQDPLLKHTLAAADIIFKEGV